MQLVIPQNPILSQSITNNAEYPFFTLPADHTIQEKKLLLNIIDSINSEQVSPVKSAQE